MNKKTHIIFIHGVGNKPEPQELLNIWRRAAIKGGLDIGEKMSSSSIYWANFLYANPISASEYESNFESRLLIEDGSDSDLSFEEQEELKFYEQFEKKFELEPNELFQEKIRVNADKKFEGKYELFPRPAVRVFLKLFVKDVYHYLYDKTYTPRPGESFRIRTEIRKKVIGHITDMKKKYGKIILVTHSMGTVIAYDCLKRVPQCPSVDGLITLGSPLGMTEVQNELKPEWSRNDGYPSEKVKNHWANFYDPVDLISRFDTNLTNDFKKNGEGVIDNIKVNNSGVWTHSAVKYLAQKAFIEKLKSMSIGEN